MILVGIKHFLWSKVLIWISQTLFTLTVLSDCVTVYGPDCATCDDDKCNTCDNDKFLGDEKSKCACGGE